MTDWWLRGMGVIKVFNLVLVMSTAASFLSCGEAGLLNENTIEFTKASKKEAAVTDEPSSGDLKVATKSEKKTEEVVEEVKPVKLELADVSIDGLNGVATFKLEDLLKNSEITDKSKLFIQKFMVGDTELKLDSVDGVYTYTSPAKFAALGVEKIKFIVVDDQNGIGEAELNINMMIRDEFVNGTVLKDAGWESLKEVDGEDFTAVVGNQLKFSSFNSVGGPIIIKKFTELKDGAYEWSFDFNFKNADVGGEGSFAFWMQLGDQSKYDNDVNSPADTDANRLLGSKEIYTGSALSLAWGVGTENGGARSGFAADVTEVNSIGYTDTEGVMSQGTVLRTLNSATAVKISVVLIVEGDVRSCSIDIGGTKFDDIALPKGSVINSMRFVTNLLDTNAVVTGTTDKRIPFSSLDNISIKRLPDAQAK